MNWRLLIEEKAPPEYNMAVDEAMLECFDPASPMPTLRLYGWEPAAVSIGYFQPARPDAASGYPLLRRITGGGAICHDGDLTYSIVVSRSDPITKPSLYHSIHEAMSNALHHLGIDAQPRWVIRGEDAPIGRDGKPALSAFFCSEREADADLVVSGRKILGSAQRRSRFAILQHGSMPIEDAACDSLMTSVRRESKNGIAFQGIASAVKDSFRSLFGIAFTEGRLSDKERELAERLAREKYGDPGWNYRR